MQKAMLWVLLATQAPVFGQIGYPGGYPPGQYPGGYPGQYPGGGTGPGIPWPRRKSSKTQDAQKVQRITGTLHKIESGALEIQAEDKRVLTIRRTDKTKFFKGSAEMKASELKTGDRVSVEATEDDRGYLYAGNVYLEAGAPAAEAGAAKAPPAEEGSGSPERATVDTPPPAPRDASDPGPPVLKRGEPARRTGPTTDDEDADVAAAPAAPARAAEITKPMPRTDPVILKAREAAEGFFDKLPNYVCKEYMARYASDTRPVNWSPIDVVSTEVVYENGKERYRNVEINGKAANKKLEEIGGSWSTGEFASVLADLFSPATAAQFQFDRDSTASGIATRVYDFRVDQPNSHWHIMTPSQTYNPAYKGSVWIDPKTGRVLRIEIQARALPEEFPLNAIESAVDYDYVRIGTGQFLLPAHAEGLSCERGSRYCSRNAIDFRNYHKFEGESSITFDTPK